MSACARLSANAPTSARRSSRTSAPKCAASGASRKISGSFLGKAHQRFEDLKAAVTGRDEKAIINEVERGEDYLKAKFETALNEGHLSGETRSAVESCYQSVREGHDQMSHLKHGMEASS